MYLVISHVYSFIAHLIKIVTLAINPPMLKQKEPQMIHVLKVQYPSPSSIYCANLLEF